MTMISRDNKQLPSPPPENGTSKYGVLTNGLRSKNTARPTTENEAKRLVSGSSTSTSRGKRTTYPNDTPNGTKRVDINDDLLIRLLAQRACTEAEPNNVLTSEELDELKHEQILLKGMIESTSRKLTLEQKVKQAAQSLYRLETAANKRQRLDSPPEAYAHLDMAQKKCDELNAELWRLSSLSMEIERKLLNHNAAVLGLGMNVLERRSLERGFTDEFDEGHLYANLEDGLTTPKRLSLREQRASAPPQPTLPSEWPEVQSRLRELNYQVASMSQSNLPAPVSEETLLPYIEQLEQNIRFITDSHTSTTRDLQTSLSESQRMIEQLKFHEQDQSAAISDHVSRSEGLERRLLQTQKEFDRVQNELEDQANLVQSLRMQLDTAKNEAHIAELASQGREAESLQREKNLRREESDRFAAVLATKEKALNDLTTEVNSLRYQHQSAQLKSQDLESRIGDQSRLHDEAIRSLETELVLLKSENAQLKAEKDEILGSRQQRAEGVRIQRELEEQRAKSARSAESEQALLEQVESLKAQNSQLSLDLRVSESTRLASEASSAQQIATLERRLTEKADRGSTGSFGSSDSNREKELEARCSELQNELASILDDFERLTSQFIDYEGFRQTLEGQVDALRAQCHGLQTELAEEKVRMLGKDATSPMQGGFTGEQTSTVTLRTEFRKMVAELRSEHIAALKAEYEERRKLEAIIREMKKDKDRERYAAGRDRREE